MLGYAMISAPSGLGWPADVQNLQRALVDRGLDPGPIDGIVGPKTIYAVAGVINQLPGIPSYVKLAIAVDLAFEGTTGLNTIATIIKNNASVLAAAVRLLPGGAGGGLAVSYPPGSIQRYHRGRKVWRIYVPVVPMSGYGGLAGYLGADAPVDKTGQPPPGTTLRTEQPAPASGVPVGVDEDDPFYKKAWFWGTVGAVAVGGTVVYIVSKKPSK